MSVTKEITNTIVISEENWLDGSSIVNAHLDLIEDKFNDPNDLGSRLGLFTTDKHLVDYRPWAVNRVKAQFIKHPNGNPGVLLTFELSPVAKFVFFVSQTPIVLWAIFKFFLVALPRDIFRLLVRCLTRK